MLVFLHFRAKFIGLNFVSHPVLRDTLDACCLRLPPYDICEPNHLVGADRGNFDISAEDFFPFDPVVKRVFRSVIPVSDFLSHLVLSIFYEINVICFMVLLDYLLVMGQSHKHE